MVGSAVVLVALVGGVVVEVVGVLLMLGAGLVPSPPSISSMIP